MTPFHRRLHPLMTLAVCASMTLACALGALTGTTGEPTASENSAAATEAPPTATSVPPTETAVPPTPTVTHLVRPASGVVPPEAYFLSDIQSGGTNELARAASGDNYGRNRFERPFTATAMEYRPDLDIVRAEISSDGTWYYFTIVLYGVAGGVPGQPLTGPYGIELDLDSDGRGDMLIRAPAPPPGDWTTDGVQIWTDGNNDVGGLTPMNADPPSASLDGYATPLFDQGAGADPDSAWVRLAASEDTGVQFAVKQSVVGDPTFLWSAWSDAGVNHPEWLDYNDHFTESEAGSVNATGASPLNSVAAVDNTCRMHFGFSPTGSEPGLCVVTGTVRNCSPHPMRMEPGGKILPPFFEPGSTLTDVRIGTYTFYDQSVEGNPVVLTATLSVGGLITITKTGFGDSYPCQ